MLVSYLKAKIHRATVTDANLDYQGSITLGRELLDASGIAPFEKVHIYNTSNGERFATYAIVGEPGTVCLNGAAAWKVRVRDRIIIASYCLLTTEEVRTYRPTLVFVGDSNEIRSVELADPLASKSKI
jgi:aspartate 1-decarboxylase